MPANFSMSLLNLHLAVVALRRRTSFDAPDVVSTDIGWLLPSILDHCVGNIGSVMI